MLNCEIKISKKGLLKKNIMREVFLPTSYNELCCKVDLCGPVGGHTGEGATVGGSQGEEQNVAAEHVVLNLKRPK